MALAALTMELPGDYSVQYFNSISAYSKETKDFFKCLLSPFINRIITKKMGGEEKGPSTNASY